MLARLASGSWRLVPQRVTFAGFVLDDTDRQQQAAWIPCYFIRPTLYAHEELPRYIGAEANAA